MREYPEVEPIILSVSEAEEVSIKDVVLNISKAIGFDGDLKVMLCRRGASSTWA